MMKDFEKTPLYKRIDKFVDDTIETDTGLCPYGGDKHDVSVDNLYAFILTEKELSEKEGGRKMLEKVEKTIERRSHWTKETDWWGGFSRAITYIENQLTALRDSLDGSGDKMSPVE